MAEIEKTIVVDVPLRTAFNQWTQFEAFPEFMEGVKEVRQFDDRSLRWRAEVGGREVTWDAVITQQVPDQVVGWRSVEGASNAGNVRFEAEGPDRTRVRLHLTYEPRGAVEGAVDALGFLARRVQGDLERFKAFIEGRRVETGAWRGTIKHPEPEGARNLERRSG